MKKYSRLTGIAVIAVALCMLVLQSCGSSSSKYGCPERIESGN